MRSTLLTIGLLILSNAFMVLAWYGHLKFKDLKWLGAALPSLWKQSQDVLLISRADAPFRNQARH